MLLRGINLMITLSYMCSVEIHTMTLHLQKTVVNKTSRLYQTASHYHINDSYNCTNVLTKAHPFRDERHIRAKGC